MGIKKQPKNTKTYAWVSRVDSPAKSIHASYERTLLWDLHGAMAMKGKVGG